MQGRSFKNGEVTQEISDPSRTYRLLGSDKYVHRDKSLDDFFKREKKNTNKNKIK